MGRHSRPEPPRRRTPLVLGAVVLLAAAVVAVILALTLGGGDDSDDTADAQLPVGSSSNGVSGAVDPTPTSTASTPSPTPTPATPTTVPPTTEAPPAAAPRPVPLLSLRVLRTSWVRVEDAKGRALVEGTLRKGTTRSFDGARLTVRTGNAAGVRFVVNGKTRPLGRSGTISEFTISKR